MENLNTSTPIFGQASFPSSSPLSNFVRKRNRSSGQGDQTTTSLGDRQSSSSVAPFPWPDQHGGFSPTPPPFVVRNSQGFGDWAGHPSIYGVSKVNPLNAETTDISRGEEAGNISTVQGLEKPASLDTSSTVQSDVNMLVPFNTSQSMAFLDALMTERTRGDNGQTLGLLDLHKLPGTRVLFCYGVLAMQMSLLPLFDYQQEPNGQRWRVKLTMYGQTVRQYQYFNTQAEAKAEACRVALYSLKDDYSSWVVPCDPSDQLAATTIFWDWIGLLKNYCAQNGLSAPVFTRYVHENGYRHEVEVGGASYFSLLKFYHTEKASQNASAHAALYRVLTSVSGSTVSLNTTSPVLLIDAAIPRSSPVSFGPTAKEKTNPTPFAPQGNANLIPLANARFQVTEPDKGSPKAETRWGYTHRELKSILNETKGPHSAKLAKLCGLIHLEFPEFRIETDGRLVDTQARYSAAAYFQGDPFLARAGGLGKVMDILGPEENVRESCCAEVVQYLINIVKEDTLLAEAAVKEEKMRMESWKQPAK
ncbi:hypothetical protein ASPZODRAFT_2122905 [Penicilliopsis zonata CBS 506.65]|uniref:DRBM domain-containing protein n=1 Tax=Penicilliopsis zonata CBS 506.65 TaxID=1073090 RepID=A0A1L9SLL9_9EURO|nr:hypothetical protein ASPZODRAFT_2122905 [Penicilliopsis zonata CBS 506.65]OJJ48088.1 hypothetical protein ASPZODRAFT_2122905 [Penicilliopsis zonata CBS 506.65]